MPAHTAYRAVLAGCVREHTSSLLNIPRRFYEPRSLARVRHHINEIGSSSRHSTEERERHNSFNPRDEWDEIKIREPICGQICMTMALMAEF